jgi:hypothetical protein
VTTVDLTIEQVACIMGLREKRACIKPHALPFLLVLPQNEKFDWFKMKNMLIYAKIIID